MAVRPASIRRLLADLRRSETRGDALRRVRSKAASAVRGSRSGSSGDPVSAAGADRPDSWYRGEWSKLAKAVFGPKAASAASAEPSTRGPEAIQQAARQRALGGFAEAVGEGRDLAQATYAAVAALTDATEWHAAWSLAEGVGRLPGGTGASAIGHLVIVHRRRQFDRVWTRVRDLDDALLATYAPIEAVDGALSDGSAAARERALAIGAPTTTMDAATLVDLAGRFLAVGERDRAAALVAELHRRGAVELDDRRRYAWTLIEGWLSPKPTTVPAGAVPVAVFDYQTPDHVLTSGNLGDYIQSLAMLGSLFRLSDVTFTGDDGLGALATELQGRVRPDLREPGVAGAMHLIALDRDFSMAADLPEPTWTIAFGWHMHPLFDLMFDFPYHPNVRPLFISFHLNRLEMLTDEAVGYLKRYGPVGCRDWNTVYLLLSAGIDAFFTGCVTTTVDALFPSREEAYHGKGAVGVIDLPRQAAGRGSRPVRVYGHQSDAYRYMSATEGLRAADVALGAYQRDLDRAITGRLHAYVPLTALGVPVEFRTSSPGDVRFAGLTDLRPGDARLTELRDGIRDLISVTFREILGGAGEGAVYASWRSRVADRVADAKARFAAPPPDAPTTIDIEAAVATSRAGRRRSGPHEQVDPATVTDIVLSFDQNVTTPAAVLLESVVTNASGPLRLWVLGRGLSIAYQDWLGAAFPDLPITFLPCDEIAYGSAGRPRRLTSRITISTMDRLLLPDMLDDVDRAVYLDVDTLMLGDVCALARTDLAGTPVAARDSNVSEASEWRRAGRRLEEPLATGLRRWMGFRHGYGAAALNAGVLVFDLDRMRRDRFTAVYLGWVERYGFHDQDTMLAYVGPDRAVLDPRWNAMPTLEDVPDPSLIHWASFGKPWDAGLTYEQERWHAVASRLLERAGPPPTA